MNIKEIENMLVKNDDHFIKDNDLKKMIVEYSAEQREDEVIWFYREVEKIKPKVIVEIGNKEGGNLKILSTHLDKDGLIIGIDPLPVIPWKMNDCKCDAYHITRSSHSREANEELINILNGRLIDVLFIDGDHSYDGMIADYEDYKSFVRPGGIIAIHDIYYLMGVHMAWHKLSEINKKCYASEYNQSSIGIGYIIKE